MVRAIPPFRLWLRVERRAKVVTTSATSHDNQLRHAGSQLRLPFLVEEMFEFES